MINQPCQEWILIVLFLAASCSDETAIEQDSGISDEQRSLCDPEGCDNACMRVQKKHGRCNDEDECECYGRTASDTDTDSDSDVDSDTDIDSDTDMDADTDLDCEQFICNRPIYVDVNVEKNGQGGSWSEALRNMARAIEHASDYKTCCSIDPEIWVASGTYYIYKWNVLGTIELFDGLSLYGGFAGGETSRSERDWMKNRTILSGSDSAGNTMIHCGVVTVEFCLDTVIDGFVITGGYAEPLIPPDEDGHGGGGGMYIMGGSPTVRNCLFTRNSAESVGGAVLIHGSEPRIINCFFRENSADIGGAIYANAGSSVTLINSVFIDNHADLLGGAICSENSAVNVINSTFVGNSAVIGSVIEHYSSNGTDSYSFTNCIIWQNSLPPVFAESGSGGTITYSDVQGIDGGMGNISKDPLFVDIDTGDLHLMEGSPCIDSASGLIAPGSDVEGNLRQDDPSAVNVYSCIDAGIDSGCVEYVDMGAYEYVP